MKSASEGALNVWLPERRGRGLAYAWVREWTIPNVLTASRIFLVPFQVYYLIQENLPVAFVFYFIAVFTDLLDGYLARRWNQRTVLGAALDPLADKLTILCVFFCLLYLEIVPRWFGYLVIARDGLILVGVWILMFARIRVPWRPIPVGKVTTFAQNATVLAAILKHFYYFPASLLNFFLAATAVFTFASFIGYVQVWREVYAKGRERRHASTH